MRKLPVTNFFKSSWEAGGVTRVAYDISKELVKMGHQVTVYKRDVYNENIRLKNDQNPVFLEGIKVYHFKNLSNNPSKRNFPIALKMFNYLKNYVQIFDSVHIHEYRLFHAVFTHHFTVKYSVSYVLQAPGSIYFSFKSKNSKKFLILLWEIKS